MPRIVAAQTQLLLANHLNDSVSHTSGKILCKNEFRSLFEVNRSDPSSKQPSFLTLAFAESHISGPATIRRLNGRTAVFNVGLHLLGGFVDDSRFIEPPPHGHGSLEKGHFVASLDFSLRNLTVSFVLALRRSGFEHIVFKNTNTIMTARFNGSWKHAADVCSLASPIRNPKECSVLLERCVAKNGDALRVGALCVISRKLSPSSLLFGFFMISDALFCTISLCPRASARM